MRRDLHSISARTLLVAALGLALPLGSALAQSYGNENADSPSTYDTPPAATPSGPTYNDSDMMPGGSASEPTPGASGSGAQGPIRSDSMDEQMRDRERNQELQRDRDMGNTRPDAGSSLRDPTERKVNETGNEKRLPFWRNNPG